MSKPIARVTLFLLISLMLIAATSVSVRGWLGGTSETASVQSHNVSGLQTNLNHDRSTVSELENPQMQSLQFQPGNGHEGGCDSEAQSNPNDY